VKKIQIKLNLPWRAKDKGDCYVDGYITSHGCPLAVTRPVYFSSDDPKEDTSAWTITHVETGSKIGGTFKTRKAALDCVAACEPGNRAWGRAPYSEAARRECFGLFNRAWARRGA